MVVCYFHFHHLTVTVVVTLPLTDHRTVLCAHGVCVVGGGGGGGGGEEGCWSVWTFCTIFPYA